MRSPTVKLLPSSFLTQTEFLEGLSSYAGPISNGCFLGAWIMVSRLVLVASGFVYCHKKESSPPKLNIFVYFCLLKKYII